MRRRWIAAGIGLLWLCLRTPALAQSCSRGIGNPPPCSGNPVPCAHCTGQWTDSYGATWSVQSNTTPPYTGTWSVSGSLTAIHPGGPGCPNVTWAVSGSLVQAFDGTPPTTFTWKGTNPQPTTVCNGWVPYSSITYKGGLCNDGCDQASGTWANSDNQSGFFTMTKPSDLPSGETSTAVAWWSGDPTIMLYDQTLSSSSYMAGRQAFESPGPSQSDSCHFVGSKYAGAELGVNVPLGGWFVGYYYFNNRWEYDYVGMFSAAVTYYRQMHRVPCEVALNQQMNICTRGCTTNSGYFSDTLYWNIPDGTNVGTARAGVQAWRTWP